MNALMAIALWCSNPGYYGLSIREVNECRTLMLKCVEEKNAQRPPRALDMALEACAKQIKLGDVK